MSGTADLHTPGLRRIQKELADFRNSNLKPFKELIVDEGNIFLWHGLICPESPPYNKGAFKVDILFPLEYPFKPPKVALKTKIYHPNFDEKGQVCLGMLTVENWKPSTSIEQVMQAFIALLNDPDPSDSLRADLGQELATNRERFFKNALAYTEQFAEQRPVENVVKFNDDLSQQGSHDEERTMD